MIHKNFYLRPDDDTDFIPIIPLNENENESDKITEIEGDIPVLPLRNTVLFPGVVLPITVGRDKSIKAVNDSYKSNN
jgi:ATP-dependent Lon protease